LIWWFYVKQRHYINSILTIELLSRWLEVGMAGSYQQWHRVGLSLVYWFTWLECTSSIITRDGTIHDLGVSI